MTFVAAAPAKPAKDLPRHPFWPAVNPDTFRDVMRVDGTVSTARLIHALTEAVVYINSELKAWRIAREAAGCLSLDAVPDEDTARLPYLYCRAVYEYATADLMERYLRFDATGDAQQRAEGQAPAIENHRRNAFWAVRDIKGEARSTMELI
ncbi:MAG: head completion/stabilization protein [Proteobacteria bacterium]|nr:head completion/stabilization protein [Pseudomonadota bacterium]